jgi:hypothetical protein
MEPSANIFSTPERNLSGRSVEAGKLLANN